MAPSLPAAATHKVVSSSEWSNVHAASRHSTGQNHPYSATVCLRPSSDQSPSPALRPWKTEAVFTYFFLKNGASGRQPTCNIRAVLTGNSCVCQSLRSKTPCCLDRVGLLCQRSAAEGDRQNSILPAETPRVCFCCTETSSGRLLTWPSRFPPIPRELSRLSIIMSSW